MNIPTLLAAKRKIFSFEFFPPRDDEGSQQLYHAIEDLRPLKPTYVSVTYGALGSNQDRTLSLVRKIKQEIGIEVMAHFTCIGAEEKKVDHFLAELEKVDIHAILALRGDIPPGVPPEVALNGPYRYARDLVRAVRAKTTGFTVAVAGYPQGHSEAKDLASDIALLRQKVDAGADYIVTQFFFENDVFYRFRDAALRSGITVPIIPGLMPIQNLKQIEIFAEKCHVTIPARISSFFTEPARTDDERRQFGIAYATAQCTDLLAHGVPGIHFYTLNKSKATRVIYQHINS